MQPEELHRVQPDRPAGPKVDEGIHSWPAGTFMPMGFYRPVPIVRFTGTVVLQGLADILLVSALHPFPGIATAGAGVVVALALARQAWLRWLSRASAAWKMATFTALGFNLALVLLAAFSPARTDPLVDCSTYPELAPPCSIEPTSLDHTH